jgi:hypothetical protein
MLQHGKVGFGGVAACSCSLHDAFAQGSDGYGKI